MGDEPWQGAEVCGSEAADVVVNMLPVPDAGVCPRCGASLSPGSHRNQWRTYALAARGSRPTSGRARTVRTSLGGASERTEGLDVHERPNTAKTRPAPATASRSRTLRSTSAYQGRPCVRGNGATGSDHDPQRRWTPPIPRGELLRLRLMRDEIAIGRPAADAARWVRGLLDEDNPKPRAGPRRAGRVEPTATLARSGPCWSLRAPRSGWRRRRRGDDARDAADRCAGGRPASATLARNTSRRRSFGVGWPRSSRLLRPRTTGTGTSCSGRAPATSTPSGLEALAARSRRAPDGLPSLGPRTSLRVLLAAIAVTPDAVVVLVSHLPTRRRSAIDSLEAASATGASAFFAGNAFLLPVSRKGVPGTYLGEGIGEAALVIAECSRNEATPA